MNTKNRTSVVVAALSGMALSGAAMAAPGYTVIKNGGSFEQQTFAQVYGGSWAKSASGLDYSGNGLTAQRLADSGAATPTSLTTGVSGTDDVWTAPGTATVTFRAKESNGNFQFGYFDDSGDHAFHQIFDTSSLSGAVNVNLPTAFRWALREGTSVLVTSHAADNVKKGIVYDQAVTYRVTGAGVNEWTMFWEDHPHSPGTTQFDDMVVSIGACRNVPAPAAAGLIGLGALGAARRRRK